MQRQLHNMKAATRTKKKQLQLAADRRQLRQTIAPSTCTVCSCKLNVHQKATARTHCYSLRCDYYYALRQADEWNVKAQAARQRLDGEGGHRILPPPVPLAPGWPCPYEGCSNIMPQELLDRLQTIPNPGPGPAVRLCYSSAVNGVDVGRCTQCAVAKGPEYWCGKHYQLHADHCTQTRTKVLAEGRLFSTPMATLGDDLDLNLFGDLQEDTIFPSDVDGFFDLDACL